jgi:hypothetical protein
MALPKLLQSALWSYDLAKVDREKHKRVIITQVLNHGTWKQVKWILDNYPTADIEEVIKKPDRGVWQKDVLNYWIKILNLKITREKSNRAIFSLKIQ